MEDQAILFRIPPANRSTGFHGIPDQSRIAQFEFGDMIGFRKNSVCFGSIAMFHLDQQVSRSPFPDGRCGFYFSILNRSDRGQLFIIDFNQLGCCQSVFRTFCQNCNHRLSDITHFILCQREPPRRIHRLSVAVAVSLIQDFLSDKIPGRSRDRIGIDPVTDQVICGIDRQNSFRFHGCRKIHLFDLRMGIGRSYKMKMCHFRKLEVIGVTSGPGDHFFILDPTHRISGIRMFVFIHHVEFLCFLMLFEICC